MSKKMMTALAILAGAISTQTYTNSVTAAPLEIVVTQKSILDREADCKSLKDQYVSVAEVSGLSKKDLREILKAVSKPSSTLVKTGSMMTATGLAVTFLKKGTEFELNLLTKSGMIIGIPASLVLGFSQVYRNLPDERAREQLVSTFDIQSEADRAIVLDFLKQRIEACENNLQALRQNYYQVSN